MIVCGIRNNLFYPIMSILFNFLRKSSIIAIDDGPEFKGSLLLALIMFLSEFIFGFIIYSYHKRFLSNNQSQNSENSKLKGMKLIERKVEYGFQTFSNAKIFKILALIFIIALIDIFQFLVDTFIFS